MRKIYLSQSYDPCFNLALEEYLVRHLEREDQILFLWQNQNTVVIGRNQNPWKECNLEELNRRKGHLVRRLSGGGAVYHDLGNLNFTFISAFSETKIKENIELLIGALGLNGLEAEFSGKNDILVQEHKISGNAYFVENDTLCHHGTLLVDVDMGVLASLLTVSKNKLQSKGIDSVRSRVINLKEHNRKISVEGLKRDLIQTFLPENKEGSVFLIEEEFSEEESVDLTEVYALRKKYESWEWNFGASPEFNYQISERFPWGEVELSLLVIDGIITEARVCTDAMNVGLAGEIETKLLHQKFNGEEFIDLFRKYNISI